MKLDQKYPAKGVYEVDNLLHYVLQQQRSVTKPQDAIYSLLGLYLRLVRFSMPIRYDISESAAMAILGYLRIHEGEVGALLSDCCDPKLGPNAIENAPSWLPRDMLGFKYPLSTFCSACSIIVDSDHRLVARAQYVPFIGAQWANADPMCKRSLGWSSQITEADEEMHLRLLPQKVSGLRWKEWNFDIHATVIQASADANTQQLSDANDIIQGAGNAVAFMILLGTWGTESSTWMVYVGMQGRGTYIKRGWLAYHVDTTPDGDPLIGTFVIQ
ncbi:MAG: hypothetical protein Q9167_007011 [Letrouitia subvulpina]